MSTATRRISSSRSTSLVVVAALLGALSLTMVWPSPDAAGAAAAAAAADECVTVGSDAGSGSCQVALEPTTLPQRTVVGEYEAGLLTRNGGLPTTAVNEFGAGGVSGSCDPASEVCSTTDRLGLLDDPRDPDAHNPTVTVPDSGFGSAQGDSAITAVDLDGDGRQEVVRGSRCAGSTQLCLSLFTPGTTDPGTAGYDAAEPTGLRLDTSGVGRIRLASGPIALAAAHVVSARFSVDAAQETTTATFTTDARHGFSAGDPVRLADDASLQAALCVDSPLSRSGEQCLGDDLLAYHPITAVTATTFSVDLGVLVVADGDVGRPVVPAPWSAECATCGVRAESVSTGVVAAWTAPNASLQIATFAVHPRTNDVFRLLDSRAVGALYRPADGATTAGREAVALAVGDFEPGGPDEIAVGWAGACSDPTLACPRLSFLDMDDATRLTLRSSPGWGSSPWCAGPGTLNNPARWSPTSVSLAAGRFRSADSGSEGDDLAIGWVAQGTAGNGVPTVDHLVQTFDVTGDLTLDPIAPLARDVDDRDPSSCASVLGVRSDPPDQAAARSQVQVVAANLDGRQGDELVVAETLPVAADTADGAPVSLSVWSQGPAGDDGPGWRPQTRRQPAIAGWTQPFASTTSSTVAEGDGYHAIGGGGSGQISLVTGRLARRQTDATVDAAYPDAINPDVIVAWTCQDQPSCGDPRTSTASDVAIDALGVDVGDDGSVDLAHEGTTVTSVRAADVPPTSYDPSVSERTYAQLVVADLDGDSSTLGDPVRSYAVGEVQPLMIMRAPPVEFAAIDGSHPGYGKDGQISSAEVYDLSNCYAANGANTDSGECPMRATYTTEGGTDASLAVSVQNSWGIDTAAKAGVGGGTELLGECLDVCWEATLELAYAHDEEQETEQQRARSFRYTTEQVANPMQDKAFVATSDVEITQVPVYYGTFSGGALPDDPDLWTYSSTPLETVFSWISTTDPQYGSVFAGPTPGSVLSYPATGSQIETHRSSVASIRREGSTRIAVRTTSNHGFLCALPDDGVDTAFPSPVDSACAGQQEPVRIRGAGAFNGSDYVVSAVRSPTEVVLQRIGAQVPVAADPCAGGGCTLSRQPSVLPVQTQEIGPGSEGSVSFEFGQVDGYQERYAVSNEASAEAATEGETEGGFQWEAHVKGSFSHNDESMMEMTLESTTGWRFDYGSAGRPGSYRITPYLADDPATGALTLTWTASPVGASGLWGNPVYGYGATGDPDLPARPDPAFSLPLLAEPYRVHTGLDDNLDVLLSSPDFATWTCDDDDVCRPRDAQTVGQPLQISATVHNYALTDLPASASRPLRVRFYLGDPDRGGYQIAEARVTSPIAPRGQAQVQATWTPPAGFAGQPGQPIYAVIDPDRAFEEVFDWSQPVTLTDRALHGKVLSATSGTLDGEPVRTFRTDVDHGLIVGDPVTVRGMGKGRGVTAEPVLASTPVTFTVASSKRAAAVRHTGRWTSDQSESCSTNNPWYGNSTKDFYTFGDGQEFQSRCPTTNNEGYFLTPRIVGNRAGVPRSALSVGAGSVGVSRDRRSVLVDVASGTSLYGAQVATRVWVCAAPTRSCSPQLAGLSTAVERTSRITVPARGTARVRVPLSSALKRGATYRIGVQLIPLSTWERPPGPGLHSAAMGGLADNQTVASVRVR